MTITFIVPRVFTLLTCPEGVQFSDPKGVYFADPQAVRFADRDNVYFAERCSLTMDSLILLK